MYTLDAAPLVGGLSLSSAYLGSVLPRVAEHYGIDPADIFRSAAMEPSLLSGPEWMVPLDKVAAIFLYVLQRSGDQALALEIGRSVQPRSYQVLGYAILGASTLHDAIRVLIRYETLAGKLGSTLLLEHEKTVDLRWSAPLSGPFACYLKEAAIAGWVTFAQRLLESSPRHTVYFDHPARGHVERWRAAMGAEVLFDAPFCGVRFPREALQLPVITADPGLKALMDREAASLLSQFGQRTNLVNEVRASIARTLPEGDPALSRVAVRVGLTPRALQWRLKEERTSFVSLVDEVRHHLARMHLNNASTSMTDIAFLLGFSEQSAFNRAFKRWEGCSPGHYRRDHSLAEPDR